MINIINEINEIIIMCGKILNINNNEINGILINVMKMCEEINRETNINNK